MEDNEDESMQMMKSEENQVVAIIWDYDGTIVDSARKNMNVTIEVLRHFDPNIEEHIPPALQSYDAYQEANHRYRNWRELYTNCYGIPSDKLDEAGRLWSPEQQRNKSIPDMFPGLAELFATLKGIPMGICSQNASENIWNTLSYYGVADYFSHIIGYADVPGNMQKPHTYGFIKCVKALNPDNKAGTYIYIGDHCDDVTFGKNGEAATGHKVICITTDYLGLNRELYSSWKTAPNYFTRNTNELKNILASFLSYWHIRRGQVKAYEERIN